MGSSNGLVCVSEPLLMKCCQNRDIYRPPRQGCLGCFHCNGTRQGGYKRLFTPECIRLGYGNPSRTLNATKPSWSGQSAQSGKREKSLSFSPLQRYNPCFV